MELVTVAVLATAALANGAVGGGSCEGRKL